MENNEENQSNEIPRENTIEFQNILNNLMSSANNNTNNNPPGENNGAQQNPTNNNINQQENLSQNSHDYEDNEDITRTIIDTANNSLNVLNRISNELNNIQQRLQNQNISSEGNQGNQNHLNNLNQINNIHLMNRLLHENRERQSQNINSMNDMNNININLNSLNKILSEMFFQDQFLFTSMAIGMLLICWVMLLTIKEEFSFSLMESENMYFCYLLINVIIFIFTWNFYLFLQNFVFYTNTLEKPQNKNSLKLKEFLMFSPFWLYCIIKYAAPNYLNTVFDAFFVVYVSIQHKINYMFSLRLYKFINEKITNITNIHLEENKDFMKKNRIHFFLIIFYNIFLLTFLNIMLDETEFFYKLILLNKVKI